MQINKLSGIEKSIASLVLAGTVLIIIAVVVFSWNELDLRLEEKANTEKLGQLGDLIGGLAGSLWALAGVLLFYKALTEQREDFSRNKRALDLQVEALNLQIKEFEKTRQELTSSRKVYEEQSKTARIQQFESTFFALLNVYFGIKNELEGKQNEYFKKIIEDISVEEVPGDAIPAHEKMVSCYLGIVQDMSDNLSHYFRAFYRIIKVIDSNAFLSEKEKHFYSKILRSQLSDNEAVVLFYNSHTVLGSKTRIYIGKYNLLKHAPLYRKPELKGLFEKQGTII